MNYTVGNCGMLCRIGSFPIADSVRIETDRENIDLAECECCFRDGIYHYQRAGMTASVQYESVKNSVFFTRKLTLEFSQETILRRISVSLPEAEETILYETFYNASAAVFCRRDGKGVCCGFENPFSKLAGERLFFEPALCLKSGEKYDCDLNFYGTYSIFGELVRPTLYRSQMNPGGRPQPRYRNPGEGTPLYFSEIQAFCGYTREYFGCDQKQFRFMLYDFFGTMPQRPKPGEKTERYLRHIDDAAKLGVDTVLLNPLWPNEIPKGGEDDIWELFPAGTQAEAILSRARSHGMRVGIYTGTAGNGMYGNSSMIPYADVQKWKKIDRQGNISGENCIADDDFCDWFIRVQKNTIRKYHLDLWNWDPGPGNGFFCYSRKHGHEPGKGGYKGFRNTLRVMKALKDEFPHLYFQGFHGNKEYGLWGFKYIDQHEAFWENEVYVMTPLFDDLSVDRETADNIRLQSTWNHFFRFMPETLDHGIAHRMVQANWMGMPDLDCALDHLGWRYALLSAIAAGGPVTVTIFPREPEKVPGYIEFYRKWIDFARKCFPLSAYTIPFGGPVGCAPEGYSKLRDNRGYLFLFNAAPESREMTVPVNERTGFTEFSGELGVSMLYPNEKSEEPLCWGKVCTFILPPYGCIVLEVGGEAAAERESTPRLPEELRSADGTFHFYASNTLENILSDGKRQISNEILRSQHEYELAFQRPNRVWYRPDRLWVWCREAIEYITVNGVSIPMTRNEYRHNELCQPGLCFGDITDAVRWGEENELCANEHTRLLYLAFPRPEREMLPETGEAVPVQGTAAPLRDTSVRIVEAVLNDDNLMRPNAENSIYVQVNLPHEQLEGVYVSVPISIGDTWYDLKRDMALEYRDGVWLKTFRSGERIHLIIDDEKLCFWAVTRDGRESETFSVPIDWIL